MGRVSVDHKFTFYPVSTPPCVNPESEVLTVMRDGRFFHMEAQFVSREAGVVGWCWLPKMEAEKLEVLDPSPEATEANALKALRILGDREGYPLGGEDRKWAARMAEVWARVKKEEDR